MAKIATAFRGSVRETGEAIIDANSLRIFAQEIHECENHITQTKHQLASIIAEKKRVERELKRHQKSIEQYEKRIADYLSQDDEDAAMSLAQQLTEKESFLQRNQKHCQQLQAHEDQLIATLKKMASRVASYRSELRMAESTGRMQSAQSKLANHSTGTLSRFGDMQDSLDRIQEKQQQFSDEMNAMDEINSKLNGTPTVDENLKASAREIIERVRRASPQEKDTGV